MVRMGLRRLQLGKDHNMNKANSTEWVLFTIKQYYSQLNILNISRSMASWLVIHQLLAVFFIENREMCLDVGQAFSELKLSKNFFDVIFVQKKNVSMKCSDIPI